MSRVSSLLKSSLQKATCTFSTMKDATTTSTTRPMYTKMMQKFQKEFEPIHMEVIDESQSHAEHEAMRGQGFLETHFNILIVSEKFKSTLPVQRHRMVYRLLEEEFANGLHALNIQAKTPEEFNKK